MRNHLAAGAGVLILAVVYGTPAARAQTCSLAPAGMAAWWAAEGNASDLLNANHGTLQGGAGFAAGQVGQGFSFDGVDDTVSVPNSATLNPTGGITITAWIRPLGTVTSLPSPNSVRTIVSKPAGLSWSSPYASYDLRIRGAEESQQLEFWTNDFSRELNSTVSIPVGVWTFVAATYDGASEKIYLNGALNASRAVSGAIVPSAENLVIGSRSLTAPGEFFTGNIDEVDIYSRALTAAEIAAIYSAGTAGKCTNIPIINVASLPDGQAGNSYSQSLKPVLGVPPYGFAITFGTLPAGLSLNTGSGVISGTPAAAGSSTFTTRVTDSAGRFSERTLALTVTTPPNCVPPPPGMVAWWTADGNANDSAGNNHGTLEGGSSYAAGMVGQAFDLDGATGFVRVPHHPSIQPSAAITIDAWIKPRAPLNGVAPVVKKVGPGDDNGYALEFWNIPNICLWIHVLGRGWEGCYTGPAPLDAWTHVAGVFAGGCNTVYVNGNPIRTYCPGGTITPGEGELHIGHDPAHPDRYYNGLIDEVEIFDRGLSTTEIRSIYAAGPGGKCRPVTDTTGPRTLNLTANPDPAPVGVAVVLGGIVDDTTTGKSNIKLAELSPDGGLTWSDQTGPFASASAPVSFNLPAFTTAGVRNLCIRGTDAVNNVGAPECMYLPVYDPSAGFVTGGGWIQSPVGAYASNPELSGKATFGFVSKYLPGAQIPSGNTEFQFRTADFRFHSLSYEWLVVAGARAQFKGSGDINGAGDYGFLITAIDGQSPGGGGVDKFRIKIWNKTGEGGEGAVIYDNKMGAANDADPDLAIGGGSIVIHQ
ncbi:MAG: putative Ig domain-containing protein [Acidobacteria bacterium]|nr:putative Ig domain-containing protein [Acidobacteriota bacterium]